MLVVWLTTFNYIVKIPLLLPMTIYFSQMNLHNFQYFVVLSVLGWVGGLGGEVNIPRASRLPVEGNNTSSHHQPSG